MTGNYLLATPHRVISCEERYSTAYFCRPFAGGTAGSAAAGRADSPRRWRRVPTTPAPVSWPAREETEAGVGDMASHYRPSTYGEQLWNYFARSYPDNVAHHYG